MNFDNEVTVGVPASDVERISILQRRYDLIEALEDYRKKRLNNVGVNISVVRARLFSLFVEIQAMLKRKLSPKDYERILDNCMTSNKESIIIETIFFLNEQLDNIRLTRIDSQRMYDTVNIEEENEAKGF